MGSAFGSMARLRLAVRRVCSAFRMRETFLDNPLEAKVSCEVGARSCPLFFDDEFSVEGVKP